MVTDIRPRTKYEAICRSLTLTELTSSFKTKLIVFLCSEGNLLKEAVRRLQLGLTPKIQRNFYDDTDDECRTPPSALPTNTFPDLCEIGIN